MALTARQAFLMRGHPTSPGQRDLVASAKPPIGSSKFTRDGRPGQPRYIYPWPRTMHADPGNLGSMVASGPKQPGIEYSGDLHLREPWVATNERLRRATIAAYQSGSI
jgi:hypothetical protein